MVLEAHGLLHETFKLKSIWRSLMEFRSIVRKVGRS